jgi:competence protein ComEA
MVGESRGTVVIWVVAGVLGALALMRLFGSGGGTAAGDPVRVERPPGASGAGSHGQGTAGAGGAVYVHVAGAVRRPGLVRVHAGSRVAAAVARAGGPSPRAELSGVNLAAQLEDGQQVVVPVAGAVPGATLTTGAPGVAGVAQAGPKPSLGTVTVEQLDEIDGIGPTLAERIVEHRAENGGLRSVNELQDVDGIGQKRFETLREALQP